MPRIKALSNSRKHLLQDSARCPTIPDQLLVPRLSRATQDTESFAAWFLTFQGRRDWSVTYSVAELAQRIGGQLRGDGSKLIHAALPLVEATPDSITFVVDAQHCARLEESAAGAVLMPCSLAPCDHIPTILVDDPLGAILQIATLLLPAAPLPPPGVDQRAWVAGSARIGEGSSVGAFAVVEDDVEIGPGCVIHPHAVVRRGSRLAEGVVIHPHAVLYPRTVVGARTIVHAGAVIGSDGFGYRQSKGVHHKVPQLGHVELGCDVEIGANTTVDRATLGATRVGDGTKIDNQVMIAHNCRIGAHNILVSQVGIAGSTTTGDHVTIAGQVGVADHVHIGDRATVCGHAGVYTDVPAGETYLGVPARPSRESLRIHLAMEKLPEALGQLAEVRRQLGLDDKLGPHRSDRRRMRDRERAAG